LAEDLTILFKKMIEDQILPFVAARSAAHSYIPTDGKDDDDESKSMFKKGFLGMLSPRRAEPSLHLTIF